MVNNAAQGQLSKFEGGVGKTTKAGWKRERANSGRPGSATVGEIYRGTANRRAWKAKTRHQHQVRKWRDGQSRKAANDDAERLDACTCVRGGGTVQDDRGAKG